MQKKAQRLSIYCDGGARGNPGPAAIGFVVKDGQGQPLEACGLVIGQATNNIAEYQAVVAALRWLDRSFPGPETQVRFHLDSLLVTSQLNGTYKIKNARLRELVFQVRSLEQKLRADKGLEIEYVFIPRSQNVRADALVNRALDLETSIHESPAKVLL
jgi:ribonuclease HI